MRLKQLLGLLTLLLVLSAVGMAGTSQLTNVSASAQGNATVITLHASGAFTHTEYRPMENLLLVDLSGVSAGQWKERTRNLDLPGVKSYHVIGYTGASGADVARVELTIEPGATVDVSQVAGALNIKIGDKGAVNAAPAVAQQKVAAPTVKPVAMKTSAPVHTGGPVVVNNIGVSRGEDTVDIEILGNGPMSAKAMKLTSPARLVVDIANAVPSGRNKVLNVNSGDVKAVRMGRFQDQPPVTRVVVDLATMREYEVVPSGNKVVVRVHEPVAVKAAPTQAAPVQPAPVVASAPKPVQSQPQAAAPVEQPKPVEVAKQAEPASTESKDFVMVEPQYHPVSNAKQANDTKASAEAAANVISGGMKASETAVMPPVSASMAPQPATNLAQQQAAAQATAAPARPKYTGEPISVNLKDVDLKDFFRLIHEISGLNIVLDPNVRGTLTLVLDDVPWDQALDLVLANNGLDRKLDGNVLRIATVDTLRKEADALRAKNEAEALSVPKVTVTHFLSYARAADVVPTVKRFLTQRGDVIADARTNSLIIQDIPASIPEVQRLLTQLDRKTQEVEIEARVIAATRTFARDIGVQVGFGWGNGPSAVGGASSVGTSPLQVGVAGPKYFTVGSNQIPLFSNLAANGPTSGLSFNNVSSNYRLDMILTMAESRGLLKILSRPRIVTQNNVQALVRQGVRVPVVTAAQLGGPPTTTYVEAFLRLTVTPQITVENTIFLNIDVENTTPDFSQQVSGNPTLITQQATTSVLVTDGGTVVIGGVIQTQNTVSVQQVPLLGSLPVVGNLFRRRAVSTSTQELLFFVTPKIVQT
ncbi:MAG TPA: type IV pilus secretin PilQ [Terriglobales bacterium]|nr:type IV pilus secretin PilQ [Terriglobales bacterium]